MKQIAVLIACHNRKAKTIACLTRLYECQLPQDTSFSVFLVDDGSTDGTKEAVAASYPDVNIILGDGNLFWAAASKLAWETAIASPVDFDYYLLLNDDTLIHKNTFQVFQQDLDTLQQEAIILIGCTTDPNTGAHTYGALKLIKAGHPATNKLIPNGSPQAADIGNANIMLVSKAVVNKIGVLTTIYAHGYADYDYTLTARKHQIPVYIASAYLGTCENDHGQKWLSSGSRFKDRLAFLYSVKGLSYHNHLLFLKRHFPNQVLVAKAKFWLKTLFPVVYDKFKK